MSDQTHNHLGPLSFDDLQKIETTNFSSLDRHHLRLLAHCLFCFKEMKDQNQYSGELPQEVDWRKWCLEQPGLSKDNVFISVLLEQFSSAANQLEKNSLFLGITPLELTIDDLIRYKRDQQEV